MGQPSNDDGHIAYVLERRGRSLQCSLRWTRLLKWDAFSEADLSDLRVVFGKKYTGCLTPEDRSIVTGLIQLVARQGQWPILDGDYGYGLFRKIVDTRRAFFATGSHRRLAWGDETRGSLGWAPALGAEGMWETQVELPPDIHAFPLTPPVYIDGPNNACGHLKTTLPDRLATRWIGASRMSEADVSNFCLRLAKEFPEATFPTPAFARLEETDAIKPVALLTVQQRAITDARDRDQSWIDLRDRLRLRLRFQYGQAIVAWDATESAVSFKQDGAIRRVTRDRKWESETIAAIRSWGFSAEGEQGDLDLFNFDSSTFRIQDGFSWRGVLETTFPELDTAKWQIEFGRGLIIYSSGETYLYPTIDDVGTGQFAVSLDLEVKGRREPLLPILQQALRGRAKASLTERLRWLRTESFVLRLQGPDANTTELAILPNETLARFAEELYELFDRNAFDAQARTRVSRWRLGELASAGLVDESCAEGLSTIVRLRERIGAGIEVRAKSAPKNLNTTIRDYQKKGLGWLSALAQVEAGGILADDMGLGKTVQVIAHLLSQKQAGKLERPALIVAPTSVIDNWADEIARFAPSLTVSIFHGGKRDEIWEQADGIDVLVTTYALLRIDSERLQSRRWSFAILDEAQYIKNPSSRSAIAARGLRATHKLCLTGTPIENRIEDIWSLFEFVMPGFLGDESSFRDRVAQPLKEAEDSAFAQELRDRFKRRLSPFILRRSKIDVLKDLPEKTEVTHAVSLSPSQRDLYDSFREAAREEIRASVSTNGIAGARMLILSRLLRLRQICCDPRLVEEGRHSATAHDSGKLDALLELVLELIGEGSRILVFSQFTSMLDLIAEALRDEGIEHLMLTGSTTNRAELIERFQTGNIPIFLISLRAGGVGLNLTAADCVIHYDPWWNPAVERQASDRVHRPGQQKPVFVYKLIADDSIESRIQHLQRQKLALVEDLLTEGDVERLEIDQDTIDYLFGD